MVRDSIVIAGATGFVGHAVTRALAQRPDRPEIVGLTRGRTDVAGAWDRLVPCDLFSLKDVEAAVAGARHVVYLVHSMLPSARLVQGSFADLDLICADNVGRAAACAGVEQIVYLGGLIPDDPGLSAHLTSRREVEAALGAHGVAVTTLRAGMVVGPGGSSFQIIKKLVDRLPAMVLPSWTAHRCQAIDLETAAALIDHVVGRPSAYGQTYDIGGPDAPRYRDMIATVGELLDRKRPAVGVPLLTPHLSRLWVSLITGAPAALVAPLIESLHHDMVCRDRRLQDEARLPGKTFREAARAALESAERKAKPAAYRRAPRPRQVGVRSVQRIPLPSGRDAEWAAHEYMRWLPGGLWPGLRVDVDDSRTASFFALHGKRPLLVLRFATERSSSDRQLFYVVGGLLAKHSERGRLEFRVTPDGHHLLTAIHEYVPALPWWLYRISQALVHRLVMRRFGAHLRGSDFALFSLSRRRTA
ncbi:MAG: NAD-dependent epimerase/dehydratase family protein [Kofleriaceae bacterium]|nr:NAD-dependent epimerase/dehydratase family protein [Kofleriaceae bacterium]